MFKAIMCNENNREMVVDVIHALTHIPKEELRHASFIRGEEIPKTRIYQKKQVTDMTIRIQDKYQIIIEMNQYQTNSIFDKNALYAFSKIVEQTTKNIVSYPNVILINIDNFNHFQTKRPVIIFLIRDNEENIESKVYTSTHLILANVAKTSYNVDKEIQKFALFLKAKNLNDLVKNFQGDEKYMAAIRTVADLSTDPNFSGYYDLEEAHEQEKREIQAYERVEGKKIQARETAKVLLTMGNLSFEQIAQATNLSMEEIQHLESELK